MKAAVAQKLHRCTARLPAVSEHSSPTFVPASGKRRLISLIYVFTVQGGARATREMHVYISKVILVPKIFKIKSK